MRPATINGLARAIKAAAEVQTRLYTWSIVTRRDYDSLIEDLEDVRWHLDDIIEEAQRVRRMAPEHPGDVPCDNCSREQACNWAHRAEYCMAGCPNGLA